MKAFGTTCRREFSVAHVSLSTCLVPSKMTDLLQLMHPLALFATAFSVKHQKVLAAEVTSVYHATKHNHSSQQFKYRLHEQTGASTIPDSEISEKVSHGRKK